MNAGTVLAIAVAVAAAPAWAIDKAERSAEATSQGYDSSASAGAPQRVEFSGAHERAESFAHERVEPSARDTGGEPHFLFASASGGDKHQGATRTSGGGGARSSGTSSRSSSPPRSDRATATRSQGSSSSRSQGSSSSRSERSASSRSERSAPPQTAAQRRHPRAGTGTGRFDFDFRGRGGRYGWGSGYYGYGRYGYYYSPYYNYWYSPFYYSGYYGYSPYYRRGRGYGGYYRDEGSLRIIVEPENTRVYVDGYYAGVVDDFDGIFQRLHVPAGRHDITLKLEGYRTQHFKVFIPYDDTIKIHYDMVRGSGEATSEEFAGPPDDYARVRDMDDESRRRGDDDRYRDDRSRDDDRYGRRDDVEGGTVRLSVTPGDASVYVDGEFRGSGRQTANLRLRPGRHRIEVVRPGFRTIEREVEVERGRSTEIEFDLERM